MSTSSQARRPARGDPAPPFCLDGVPVGRYCLEQDPGEPVVLVFYPADSTPICTQQLRSYSEDIGRFEELGARVLCLSPQNIESHERFAAEQDLKVPLLADVDSDVARRYDILGPLGFYRRSVFVVDGLGIVRFARRSLSSMTYVPSDQLLGAVRAAGEPSAL